MLGPDGTKSYCRADYEVVVPMKTFSGLDAFCDENGVINNEFPRMHWKVTFQENEGYTKVMVEVTFIKEEDLLKIIEMGFEQGFTAAHGNLDELLQSMAM